MANDKVAAFVLGAAEPLLPNNFTVWAEAHDKAVVMLGITQPLPAGSDVVAVTQPDDVGEDRDRKRRVVTDASIDDDPAVGVFTPYHPDNAAGIGSIETTDRHQPARAVGGYGTKNVVAIDARETVLGGLRGRAVHGRYHAGAGQQRNDDL